MFEAVVTLKNYRCFNDQNPCIIKIGNGFTALVGPNNSGKSTFLRFFYEFRNLFSLFDNWGPLQQMFAPAAQAFSIFGAEDPLEIFSNSNDRELTIQLDFGECTETEVNRLVIRMSRSSPSTFLAEFTCGWNRQRLTKLQGQIDPANGLYQFIVDGSVQTRSIRRVQYFSKLVVNSMYVGAFRNAINEGSGNYFDLPVGTAFISQWNTWKTGSSRAANSMAQKISQTIAHIFGYNRLEINATPDQKTLQVVLDGKPYRLRELGSGLAQFIIVLAHIATRKQSFILADEPEINLHPSLQLDFLTSLAEYAENGIIFATHSIGLARSSSDRIFAFRKTDGETLVRPFEATSNMIEFVGEMSFSSFKELGYETILLVEGTSEVKTIQQFLRQFRKDHTVVVLPLGGSSMIRDGIEAELMELQRLSKSIYVLIDSEKVSESAPLDSKREKFRDICLSLGFGVHVTERRATENYFSERAIKELWGESARALLPFELLRDLQNAWPKSENWRVARNMTKSEILETDVGQFLGSLP